MIHRAGKKIIGGGLAGLIAMVANALWGIARRVKRRLVLKFNVNNRDRWVAQQARLVPPGSRVLDVGAGTCPYRSLFDHCTYRTHDFAQLEVEKNRDGDDYGHIDYVSDVTDIPVKDGEFDVIMCTEVLEHVPRPEAAVREMARIIADGGTLLLTAPLGSGLHQEPYHFYGGYTPYWYERVMAEAEFELVTIEPNGDTFQHYGQMGQYIAMRLAPWNAKSVASYFFFPLWLVVAPLLVFIVPAFCHIAHIIVKDERFTVGYHVRARRKPRRT